jgi:hypothetical protein
MMKKTHLTFEPVPEFFLFFLISKVNDLLNIYPCKFITKEVQHNTLYHINRFLQTQQTHLQKRQEKMMICIISIVCLSYHFTLSCNNI